jgi:hypothetical protein
MLAAITATRGRSRLHGTNLVYHWQKEGRRGVPNAGIGTRRLPERVGEENRGRVALGICCIDGGCTTEKCPSAIKQLEAPGAGRAQWPVAPRRTGVRRGDPSLRHLGPSYRSSRVSDSSSRTQWSPRCTTSSRADRAIEQPIRRCRPLAVRIRAQQWRERRRGPFVIRRYQAGLTSAGSDPEASATPAATIRPGSHRSL